MHIKTKEYLSKESDQIIQNDNRLNTDDGRNANIDT